MTLSAVLLVSCSHAPITPRYPAAFSIPIEVSSNLPLARVGVNGSTPAWFVVDTGAEASVVSSEWADSLGLEVEEGMEVTTTGGELDADLVTGAILTLRGVGQPDAELHDVTLLVIPLAGLEAGLGRPLGGILGADLFERFVVEFDYAANTLRLYEPESYRNQEGRELAVRIENGTPYVQATIEGPSGERISVELLLDTGASGALTLNTPFVNRHQLLKSSEGAIPLASAAILAGGGAQRFLSRTRALHAGPERIPDVLTVLAQDEEGDLADSTYDGLVGGELLRRYTFVVDYARERVVLEPGEDARRPTEFDASGLSLGSAAPDFQTLRVRLVITGSPAADAGVEPGDVLVAIDGRAVAEYGLDGVRRLLRRVGERHQLTLRRGANTVEVTITTRRLI